MGQRDIASIAGAGGSGSFSEVCKAVLEASIAVSILVKKQGVTPYCMDRIASVSSLLLTAMDAAQGRASAGLTRLAELDALRASVVPLLGTHTASAPFPDTDAFAAYWGLLATSVAHCTITQSLVDSAALAHALSKWLPPEHFGTVYSELSRLEVGSLDGSLLEALYGGLAPVPAAQWIGPPLRRALMCIVTGPSCEQPGDPTLSHRLRRVDSLVSSLLHLFSFFGAGGSEHGHTVAPPGVVVFVAEVLGALADIMSDISVPDCNAEECGTVASLCYQLYQISCWMFGGMHLCMRAEPDFEPFKLKQTLTIFETQGHKYGNMDFAAFYAFPQHQHQHQQAPHQSCVAPAASIATDVSPNMNHNLDTILSDFRLAEPQSQSLPLSRLQCALIAVHCPAPQFLWPYVQICIKLDQLVNSAYNSGPSRSSEALLKFRLELQAVLARASGVTVNETRCPVRMVFQVLLGAISRRSPWMCPNPKTGGGRLAVVDGGPAICCDLLLILLAQFTQLDVAESQRCCSVHGECAVGAELGGRAPPAGGTPFRSATLACCLCDLGSGLLPHSLLDLVGGAVGTDLSAPSTPSADDLLLELDGECIQALLPLQLLVLSLMASTTASPIVAGSDNSVTIVRNYLSARQLDSRAVLRSLGAQGDLPCLMILLVDGLVRILRSENPFAGAIPALLDVVRGTIDDGSFSLANGVGGARLGLGGRQDQSLLLHALRTQLESLQGLYVASRKQLPPCSSLDASPGNEQALITPLSRGGMTSLLSHVVVAYAQQWRDLFAVGDTELECGLKLLSFIQSTGSAYCHAQQNVYNNSTHCTLLNMIADGDVATNLQTAAVAASGLFARVNSLLHRNDSQLLAYYEQIGLEISSDSVDGAGAGKALGRRRFLGAQAADVVLVRHIRALSAYLALVDAHVATAPDPTCLPVNQWAVWVHIEALLTHYSLAQLPAADSCSLVQRWAGMDWDGVILRWLQRPTELGSVAAPTVVHADLLLAVQRCARLLRAAHLGDGLTTCLEHAVSYLEDVDTSGGSSGAVDRSALHAVCFRLLLLKDVTLCLLGTTHAEKVLEILSHIVFSRHCSYENTVMSRYMNYIATRQLSIEDPADALLVELVNNVLGMFFCDVAQSLLSVSVAEGAGCTLRGDSLPVAEDAGCTLRGDSLPVLLPVAGLLNFAAMCSSTPTFNSALASSALHQCGAVIGEFVSANCTVPLRTEPRVCSAPEIEIVREYIVPRTGGAGRRATEITLIYRLKPVCGAERFSALTCDLQRRDGDMGGGAREEYLGQVWHGVVLASSVMWRVLAHGQAGSAEINTPDTVTARGTSKGVFASLRASFQYLRQFGASIAAVYWRELCSVHLEGGGDGVPGVAECLSCVWETAVGLSDCSLGRSSLLMIACTTPRSGATDENTFPWLHLVAARVGGAMSDSAVDLDVLLRASCSVMCAVCLLELENCLWRHNKGGSVTARAAEDVETMLRLVASHQGRGRGQRSADVHNSCFALSLVLLLYALVASGGSDRDADSLPRRLCGTVLSLLRTGEGSCSGNDGRGAWMASQLSSQQCLQELLAVGGAVSWPGHTSALARRCFQSVERGGEDLGDAPAMRQSPVGGISRACGTPPLGQGQGSTPSRRGKRSAASGNMLDVLLSHSPARTMPGSARRAPGSGGSTGRQPSPVPSLPQSSPLSAPAPGSVSGFGVRSRSGPGSGGIGGSGSGRPPTPRSAGTDSPFAGNKRLFGENVPVVNAGTSRNGESPTKAARGGPNPGAAAGSAAETETEAETRWSPPKSFMVFSKLA